jgi:hypothetical protein
MLVRMLRGGAFLAPPDRSIGVDDRAILIAALPPFGRTSGGLK